MSNVTLKEIENELFNLRTRGFEGRVIEMSSRDADGLIAFLGLPPAERGASRSVLGMKIVERPAFVIHATPIRADDMKREVW